MTRIDGNQQRVPSAGSPATRPPATTGASPEAFAELLRAAQDEPKNHEATVAQVARLLAGGKLDPQAAVMLSLAAGNGLDLPVPGPDVAPNPYTSATLRGQPVSDSALERFNTLKPHFLQAERQTGVPWQIQAAQWALETGWGRSTPKDQATGRESHNLFGVKGTGPAGFVESATTEFVAGRMVQTVDRFRAYHSDAESIVEHARLLTTDYYQPAHAAGTNLKAWTEMLGPQRLGYATDPDYSRKLWQIITDQGWDRT